MDTVAVLTRKDLHTFLEEGGSGYWKGKEDRIKNCDYFVATANAHHKKSKYSEDFHRHAFIVGKVDPDRTQQVSSGRIVICFTEYAVVDIPDVWHKDWRNPIRYTSLEELGIDPDEHDWQEFPVTPIKEADTTEPLTLEQAKKGLAKQLGISPDCIEITIRA